MIIAAVCLVAFCAMCHLVFWALSFPVLPPRSEQDKQEKRDNSRRVSGAKKAWSNADLGTPEFFEWLNTIPADAAERLGG